VTDAAVPNETSKMLDLKGSDKVGF